MDHDEYIRRARIARSRRPYRPSEDAYAQLERMNGRGIMDNRLLALGRRAIACKGWRWMEGMKYEAYSVLHQKIVTTRVEVEGAIAKCECIPDLSDPATLGCLEALVLEAYEGRVSMQRAGTWWSVRARDEWGDGCTHDYADALVCALEDAP